MCLFAITYTIQKNKEEASEIKFMTTKVMHFLYHDNRYYSTRTVHEVMEDYMLKSIKSITEYDYTKEVLNIPFPDIRNTRIIQLTPLENEDEEDEKKGRAKVARTRAARERVKNKGVSLVLCVANYENIRDILKNEGEKVAAPALIEVKSIISQSPYNQGGYHRINYYAELFKYVTSSNDSLDMFDMCIDRMFLKQIRGTCWYNAALNGLLASRRISAWIVNPPEEVVVNPGILKQMWNMLKLCKKSTASDPAPACPVINYKTIRAVFQLLLYNHEIKIETAKEIEEQIIQQTLSKELLDRQQNIKEEEEGGRRKEENRFHGLMPPHTVMLEILNNTIPTYIKSFYDPKPGGELIEPNLIKTNHNIIIFHRGDLISSGISYTIDQQTIKFPIIRRPDPDTDTDTESNTDADIDIRYLPRTILGGNFTLDHACIYLMSVRETENHAIATGIDEKCDLTYVMDSNDNMIKIIDWTTSGGLIDMLDFPEYKNYSHLYYNYVVYSRNNEDTNIKAAAKRRAIILKEKVNAAADAAVAANDYATVKGGEPVPSIRAIDIATGCAALVVCIFATVVGSMS
jgi:hypothetical protein